jgi:cytochrome P450
MMFIMMPHRMFFDCFDSSYWGKGEKTLLGNMNRFRDMIRGLINERRNEMKADSTFLDTHSDFLTILLGDDLFAQSDEMIIDECATFMLAGTMTSSILFSNNMYNIIRYADKRQVVRDEIQKLLGGDFKNPSP